MNESHPGSRPEQRGPGDTKPVPDDEHLQRLVGDDTGEWLEEFSKLMGLDTPEQDQQAEDRAGTHPPGGSSEDHSPPDSENPSPFTPRGDHRQG